MKVFFPWLLTVSYMAAIYYISDNPDSGAVLPAWYGADKVAHCTEFGILAVLIFSCVRVTFQASAAACQTAATLMASLYAVLDEIHQHSVPNRTASVEDAMADIAGAFLFAWWMKAILHRKKKKW